MEEAIKKDQEQYPHCHYSRKSSSSYLRDATGATQCEKLEQAYRNCPNERPVSIFTNKSTSSNDYDDTTNNKNSNELELEHHDGRLGGGLGRMFGSFGGSIPDLHSMMEGMFSGSGIDSQHPPSNRDKHTEDYRPRRQSKSTPRERTTRTTPPHHYKKGERTSRSFQEYRGIGEEV